MVRASEQEGSYAEKWKTTYEVCFHVVPDWGRRSIPGLHSLFIERAGLSPAGWVGNDMGLRIIDRLTADKSLGSLEEELTISPFRVEDYYGAPQHYGLDPHEVANQRMIITYSTTSEAYRDKAPSVRWKAPPENSWGHLDAIARILLAEPELLPEGDATTREFLRAPAPLASFYEWTLLPLLALGALAGGITAISVDWSGRPIGWMIFTGTVLLLIGVGAAAAAVARFLEIREGCTEIVGVVDRKWTADEMIEPGVGITNRRYVCVEGLPFLRWYPKTRQLAKRESSS